MSKDFENNNFNNGEPDFGLPDGYFSKSAGNIVNKIEWIEEHKQYPKLSELKKETGFVVPFDYFNDSETHLELLAYPALTQLKKDSGFIVPSNYFDESEVSLTANSIEPGVEDNLDFEYLSTIPKTNSFTVSDTYFEESSARIAAKLGNKQTKVISLFGRKAFFSAAAALFAVAIGLWVYNQYFKPAAIQDCGTLACVDKNDLIKSKSLESLDNDELYELVDTKKLEEKLEHKTPAKQEKKQVDSSLKDISTDALLDEL